MYLPKHFAVDDADQIAAFVARCGAADLVSVDSAGQPVATLMPCIWEPAADGAGTLYMHMSRANEQWKSIAEGGRGLAIVHGEQAYITPSSYPSKADTGKVVPTWNYTAVHFTGVLSVSHDPDYLLDVVSRLTDRFEAHQSQPWHVTDAPQDFVAAQLRAIVAVTMAVDGVQAKAKLGQNRSDEDRISAASVLVAGADTQAAVVGRAMLDPSDPLR